MSRAELFSDQSIFAPSEEDDPAPLPRYNNRTCNARLNLL